MNRHARYALAGLQAGITGAIAMLAWFALASIELKRSLWWIPNLLASTYYREHSVRYAGFSKDTLQSIAFILFVYAVIGIVFGSLLRNYAGGLRVFLISIAVGTAAYFVMLRALLNTLGPAAMVYLPERMILVGHLIYGLFLARTPKIVQRIQDSLDPVVMPESKWVGQ